MIILFIDTSIIGEIRSAVVSDGKLGECIIEKVDRNYSEMLLTIIDNGFKLNKTEPQKLNAIVVVSGPGRFSALRTGLSAANVLAWQLNIPVAGLAAIENDDKYWDEILLRISQMKFEEGFKSALLPEYGQEPNITIKKKG